MELCSPQSAEEFGEEIREVDEAIGVSKSTMDKWLVNYELNN